MPNLTAALDVAAKAFVEDRQSGWLGRGLYHLPGWDDCTAEQKDYAREVVLPAVTALAKAGLLREAP